MKNNELSTFSEVEIRDFSDLEASFLKSASVLKREYLNQLSEYDIVDLKQEFEDKNIADFVEFYELKKLVYNKNESFLGKLTTVARAASISNCSLVTIIKCDGEKTTFWIGAVNKEFDSGMTRPLGQTLESSFCGNFAGSEIKHIDKDIVKDTLSKLSEDYNVVSAVSNVASLRDENIDIEKYVQGIENLIDALQGKVYSIVTIADPISNRENAIVLDSLEQLYSQLSGFEKTEMSINENSSFANSKQYTKSFASAIGKNTSVSQSHTTQSGWSKAVSEGESKTKNMGAVAAGIAGVAAVGLTVATGGTAVIAGAAIAAVGSTVGGAIGSKTKSKTKTRTKQGSKSNTTTSVEGTQKTETNTESEGSTSTETLGAGRTLSFSVENKTVKNLLENIDEQIERLKECASYGSFSACTYVLSEDIDTNMSASSLFNALISGEKSNIQIAKVNSWGICNFAAELKEAEREKKEKEDEEKAKKVINYISKLTHPRFVANYEDMEFTPASLISGKELSIQLGLPKKSVQGLSVISKVPFGRNVLHKANNDDNKQELGFVYNMGKAEKNNVYIDTDSLAAHVLVTGSTGTGKSNAVYNLLSSTCKCGADVHFMVVEPAKGEYKHTFYKNDKVGAVEVYGTNPKKTKLLQINPFSFPDDIHVLEHIDRLVEILNVCWPMYAAMPAILKNAIIKSYERCGWDITNSVNKHDDRTKYPCFADVLQAINEILEISAFSAENKGDYTGALCTRVESLTTGLNGQILSATEIPKEELFDKNVIVDLSRVGSVETKSLIMGLLVMKLQEYRMASNSEPNLPLQHIMVLEEAHSLLKKTSTEQTTESSNLTGKSVEMITNAIAEMRTYGEGFFIVDQAPNLLDEAVIRNTNTKIVFRLPEGADREIVGRAMALSDEQIIELARLEKGCAAVYQNDWEEAVLCKLPEYHKNPEDSTKDKSLYEYGGGGHIKTQSEIKKEILKGLINLVFEEDVETEIDDLLDELNVPWVVKENLRKAMHSDNYYDIRSISRTVVELYGAESAIEFAKDSPDVEIWNEGILDMIDPELRQLPENYKKVFVQCLLVEKAERNPEFKPYVERWIDKMSEV